MAFYHTIVHKCALDKCNQYDENDETISESWLCDICGEEDDYDKDREDIRYRCHRCDYDICENCYEKYKIYATIKEDEDENNEEDENDEDYKYEIDELEKPRKRESLRYIIHNKGGKLKLPKHKFRKILSDVLGIHKPTTIFSKDRKNYFSFRTNEIISPHIYHKFIENGLEFIDCRE